MIRNEDHIEQVWRQIARDADGAEQHLRSVLKVLESEIGRSKSFDEAAAQTYSGLSQVMRLVGHVRLEMEKRGYAL